jgi:hypothetical protein
LLVALSLSSSNQFIAHWNAFVVRASTRETKSFLAVLCVSKVFLDLLVHRRQINNENNRQRGHFIRYGYSNQSHAASELAHHL